MLYESSRIINSCVQIHNGTKLSFTAINVKLYNSISTQVHVFVNLFWKLKKEKQRLLKLQENKCYLSIYIYLYRFYKNIPMYYNIYLTKSKILKYEYLIFGFAQTFLKDLTCKD